MYCQFMVGVIMLVIMSGLEGIRRLFYIYKEGCGGARFFGGGVYVMQVVQVLGEDVQVLGCQETQR